MKLVISNKSSDFSNNPNISVTVDVNNQTNINNARFNSESSDLVQHNMSSSGDMEIVRIKNEELNEKKKTAKTILNINNNNNNNNKYNNNDKQVPMSEEDLIPAENLNSGLNFTKQFFTDCSKKQDRLR